MFGNLNAGRVRHEQKPLSLAEIKEFRDRMTGEHESRKDLGELLDELNALLDVAKDATDKALALSGEYLSTPGLADISKLADAVEVDRLDPHHIPTRDELDAGRYRWLRRNWHVIATTVGDWRPEDKARKVTCLERLQISGALPIDEDSLDEAIDRAILASGKNGTV